MTSRVRFDEHEAGRARSWLAALVVVLLAGCAGEGRIREAPAPRPADVKARIERLLPAGTADRPGWATDVYAAMAALDLSPNLSNICAALAVTEQETGYRVDPAVPRLSQIAWEEIDRRAERLGVPKVAVRVALKLPSSNGKSYSDRIDAVKTERELSEIFEDFIDMAPMGKRLFGGYNPVRTGGPMQVSIRFAEEHAQRRPYPYPVAGSIRQEVFTRRGGLYFGIAHLLDYPVSYDRKIYRFADFNAGHYASRNAAFQKAVGLASGIPLALDGDLIRHGAKGDEAPGSTELAVRALAKRIDLDDRAIRRALEQGDSLEFERTVLYERVFRLAERLEGKPLARAVMPQIALEGPKISRKLTTEWFAGRVDTRYRRCLASENAAGDPG